MNTHTPFFPALRRMLAPMRSPSRRARDSAAALTLARIEDRLGPALEPGLLQKPAAKACSRERLYALGCLFWSWIWQILQAKASCRETVRQIQALRALKGRRTIKGGTAGYCRARARLPLPLLEKVFAGSARAAQKAAPARRAALQGRRLRIADASTVRLPDTPPNRAAYPAPKHQGDGPGFPLLYLSALFCALSGALIAVATGNCHQGEWRLFLTLRAHLAPGDILCADRGYGNFVMAAWLQSLKADLIARVPTGARRVDFRSVRRRHGRGDALFVWRKPPRPSPLLGRDEWRALPAALTVRLLRHRVTRKGFRTKEITLVTTLLDPVLYPAHEVLAAYLLRWRLELCFDDLKTTLGMETLTCKSPPLAARELLCYLTAHNLLRWLMLQAAHRGEVPPERLSFKGTLDAFRQWSIAQVQIGGPHKKRRQAQLWLHLLETLAADKVPHRPGRREPRAVKKRSKYPPLQKPRRLQRDPLSRNQRRVRATAKKKLLETGLLLK
jgi:hypothetical protein